MKTKVESFVLQVLIGSFKGTFSVAVTSSAHGSSVSLDIIPQSPLGRSGTRSKQKIVEESRERERERERGKTSFLLLSFFDISLLTSSLLSCYISLFLFLLFYFFFFY